MTSTIWALNRFLFVYEKPNISPYSSFLFLFFPPPSKSKFTSNKVLYVNHDLFSDRFVDECFLYSPPRPPLQLILIPTFRSLLRCRREGRFGKCPVHLALKILEEVHSRTLLPPNQIHEYFHSGSAFSIFLPRQRHQAPWITKTPSPIVLFNPLYGSFTRLPLCTCHFPLPPSLKISMPR